MSKFTHLTPAYAIATGDTAFAGMQVSGQHNMVTVELQDLAAADCSVELHQSIDANLWGLVPNSNQVLTPGQTSHHWNVSGLVEGSFVRMAMYKGSAAAGTINAIKLLSND